MAKLSIDLADESRQSLYPHHGWALNSQGVKLLWLPIIRLLHNSDNIRTRLGAGSKLKQGDFHEIRCFQHALQNLCLTLRELHRTTTFLASRSGLDNPKQDVEGIGQTIPLFVDLTYVYLRRLADHFTRAIRYSVFKSYQSAPREFKKLKSFDAASLQHLGPLGDLESFINAITQNSSWFEQIRGTTTLPNGKFRKGIRDALEHHPVTISVQSSKVEGEPWTVEAYLWSSKTNHRLIGPIPEMILEICRMFTEVQRSIGWGEKYELWNAPYGDCLTATGSDEDWTGYWPKI